jgi:tripartite-type tricarboxylate transporter receptor subunit TctC
MAIAISLLVPVPVALAQAFPGKVVRVIIPFPTGSSTDAQARILGPLLSERWKQQVIVDSRPGATTIIGTDLVAKSPPDGHTLLFTSIQFAYVPALFAKLPYDPRTDLVPVTIVSFSPEAIVAHPSLPAKNVRELIALARARPSTWARPATSSPRATSTRWRR